MDGEVTLALCGDVMLGRGVDQILPHPGDPELRESFLRDARGYVQLAERANGPVPRPVDVTWPWGDALAELEAAAPDVRVLNLETSVTTSGDFWPGKTVHYRMSPANIGCLRAARPDVCVLANNHVLDFGHPGLLDTLAALQDAGLAAAGAGRGLDLAQRPAVVRTAGGGRVLVLAFGLPSSGIPRAWAARADRAGVALLPDLSEASAAAVLDRVRRWKRPGDLAVASVHWGPNWGYDVAPEEVHFARRLLHGGVDLVHGHSSHHPRPVEVYRGKLVLYGCGDFVDDYEGITGHERYRDDLRLLYLPVVEAASGRLRGLRIVPFQAHRMRLRRASRSDSRWLQGVLGRISRDRGVRLDRTPDDVLVLRA